MSDVECSAHVHTVGRWRKRWMFTWIMRVAHGDDDVAVYGFTSDSFKYPEFCARAAIVFLERMKAECGFEKARLTVPEHFPARFVPKEAPDVVE